MKTITYIFTLAGLFAFGSFSFLYGAGLASRESPQQEKSYHMPMEAFFSMPKLPLKLEDFDLFVYCDLEPQGHFVLRNQIFSPEGHLMWVRAQGFLRVFRNISLTKCSPLHFPKRIIFPGALVAHIIRWLYGFAPLVMAADGNKESFPQSRLVVSPHDFRLLEVIPFLPWKKKKLYQAYAFIVEYKERIKGKKAKTIDIPFLFLPKHLLERSRYRMRKGFSRLCLPKENRYLTVLYSYIRFYQQWHSQKKKRKKSTSSFFLESGYPKQNPSCFLFYEESSRSIQQIFQNPQLFSYASSSGFSFIPLLAFRPMAEEIKISRYFYRMSTFNFLQPAPSTQSKLMNLNIQFHFCAHTHPKVLKAYHAFMEKKKCLIKAYLHRIAWREGLLPLVIRYMPFPFLDFFLYNVEQTPFHTEGQNVIRFIKAMIKAITPLYAAMAMDQAKGYQLDSLLLQLACCPYLKSYPALKAECTDVIEKISRDFSASLGERCAQDFALVFSTRPQHFSVNTQQNHTMA